MISDSLKTYPEEEYLNKLIKTSNCFTDPNEFENKLEESHKAHNVYKNELTKRNVKSRKVWSKFIIAELALGLISILLLFLTWSNDIFINIVSQIQTL